MQGRLAVNALTAKDKTIIEQMYEQLLGKTLKRTSCSDCYRDAVIEIKIKLNKNMDKPKYALKNGVLLYQHSTGKVFNNFNMTDRIAAQHLKEHPDDVRFFAIYQTIEQIVEGDGEQQKTEPKATRKKLPKTTI